MKLLSGKLDILKRKLHLSVGEVISIQNCSRHDVVYEVEENTDGTKPTVTIRIKRLLRRRKK
jgi:hypothetical protein